MASGWPQLTRDVQQQIRDLTRWLAFAALVYQRRPALRPRLQPIIDEQQARLTRARELKAMLTELEQHSDQDP